MMDGLIAVDQWLLHWINEGWSNGFLDQIMPWWRAKTTWIPLYIGLTAWLIWRYRQRSWPFIVLLLLTVVVTDITSSSVIKPLVGRLRPCQEPALAGQLHVLIPCGPGKSFTSSHATNHFGFAVMLALLFARGRSWRWVIALGWAASIALGQVYVGVHYPFDILAGAGLGSGIAVILYQINQKTGFTRTFAGA